MGQVEVVSLAQRAHRARPRTHLPRSLHNELSANPKAIDEQTRAHYAALYARPGNMHAAFNPFAAFTQDAIDNQAFLAKGKLTMPILTIGAEQSYSDSAAYA